MLIGSRTAEAEIDARFDFLDRETGVRAVERSGRCREIQRLRAEVQIVIFDLRRPVLGDAVLKAGTRGPAGTHERSARAVGKGVGEAALILRERDTALP